MPELPISSLDVSDLKVVPDFFIAGAPKCGSTSPYHYLNEHPEIYMPPENKEPRFTGFCGDLGERPPLSMSDPVLYQDLFSTAREGQKLGEASVCYFFSEWAAEKIRLANPDAKIVIILRSPFKALASSFLQRYFAGIENVNSLQKALKLQRVRREKPHLANFSPSPASLQYEQVLNHPIHLKRFLAHFPDDKVFVMLLEELNAGHRDRFAELLRFLGVAEDFEPSWKIYNKAADKNLENVSRTRWRYRFPRLNRMINVLIPSVLRKKLASSIFRVWQAKEPDLMLSKSQKVHLYKQFTAQTQELAKLLNRDLSHWIPPSPDDWTFCTKRPGPMAS